MVWQRTTRLREAQELKPGDVIEVNVPVLVRITAVDPERLTAEGNWLRVQGYIQPVHPPVWTTTASPSVQFPVVTSDEGRAR